jgi:hypothetical protein
MRYINALFIIMMIVMMNTYRLVPMDLLEQLQSIVPIKASEDMSIWQ